MLKLYTLLAQATDPLNLAPTPAEPGRVLGLAVKDLLLVIGAVLVVGAILFLWAYWTRRDPRRKAEKGARVLYHSNRQAEGKVRMRRRRSRHPDNLPRNPTLAEAGGLPPARDEPAEPAC
jgi:hypothetical protein